MKWILIFFLIVGIYIDYPGVLSGVFKFFLLASLLLIGGAVSIFFIKNSFTPYDKQWDSIFGRIYSFLWGAGIMAVILFRIFESFN